MLTTAIAYQALQKFFQERPFVLFGTGTSCAVHPDYGMPALAAHLLDGIPRQAMSEEQQGQWRSVSEALANGGDLESALNGITDRHLVRRIVNGTAELLDCLDSNHGRKILMAEQEWPALALLKPLMKLLVSERVLHVATPNYDLLAEYAFEQAGISYTTGFVGGVCRRLDWPRAERAMTHSTARPRGRKRTKNGTETLPHIRLYKVHGSLNTFKYHNQIVENNAWMRAVPDGIERVMITPGTMKYEELHAQRAALLGAFDDEVERHRAFLFIGFGFNDTQLITDALCRRLCDQRSHALIITRDSNERIEKLAKECDNLWLVCRHHDGGREGTRIFNSRKGEVTVELTSLWDSKQFAAAILGG